MNELRLKTSLITGSNYITDKGLEIINYKIGDIYRSIGIEEYCQALQIIKTDKIALLKKGYGEAEIDYYLLELTAHFIEIFIKCKEVKYHAIFGEYIVYVNDTEFIFLNNDELKDIFNIVKEMYCLVEEDVSEDDIVFDNDEVAKKFAEFFEAEKNMKDDSDEGITVDSIIEYVSNKSPSLNMINIWDLTMWQLYRSYLRLRLIDNYDDIMMGIYSGTISGNKINIEKIRADKVIH